MSERSQVTRIWKCYLLTDWLGLLQEMLPHRKTWHMMSVLVVLHLFLYLRICLSLCLCHYLCHCRQWWYLISLSHLLFKNIGNDGCFRNLVFVIVSDLFGIRMEILQKNCICLLKADPINFDLARFCYSHSKYFQLRQKEQTLGLSMQNLVENIFNQEFDKEMKLHYG